MSKIKIIPICALMRMVPIFLLLSLVLAAHTMGQITQDFEDASVPLRTNDCYSSASLSVTTTDAITLNSARSSQLSNPASPASYSLPFINIQSGAVLSFKHKLNVFNGTRSLRVELLSAADNTATTANNPVVLLDYSYVNATVQNVSLPVGVTGVYRIRFVGTGSGGNSRVVLDDIQLSSASRSTIGTGSGPTLSGCNALIPASLAPTAVDDNRSAYTLSSTTFQPLTNDIAGSSAINPNRIDLNPSTSVEDTILAVSQGTFSVSGGFVTFVPTPGNFTVPFSITYTVKDNVGNTSNVAQITLSPLGPSAAEVEIDGRVVSDSGRAVARATVSIIDPASGNVVTATTNPFGYFRFKGVEVGNYVIEVRSKSYAPISQFIQVFDQVAGLEIVLPER